MAGQTSSHVSSSFSAAGITCFSIVAAILSRPFRFRLVSLVIRLSPSSSPMAAVRPVTSLNPPPIPCNLSKNSGTAVAPRSSSGAPNRAMAASAWAAGSSMSFSARMIPNVASAAASPPSNISCWYSSMSRPMMAKASAVASDPSVDRIESSLNASPTLSRSRAPPSPKLVNNRIIVSLDKPRSPNTPPYSFMADPSSSRTSADISPLAAAIRSKACSPVTPNDSANSAAVCIAVLTSPPNFWDTIRAASVNPSRSAPSPNARSVSAIRVATSSSDPPQALRYMLALDSRMSSPTTARNACRSIASPKPFTNDAAAATPAAAIPALAKLPRVETAPPSFPSPDSATPRAFVRPVASPRILILTLSAMASVSFHAVSVAVH